MIGIYKITNPKGAVYIGQSYNIFYRFSQYKRLNCKPQRKLYNSLNKYGYENHTFEIIETCYENLNVRERYYQDLYNVISKNGLNCRLTKLNDKSGTLSNETKKKIGDGNRGKIRSIETRNKISIANINGKNKKCKQVICIATNKTWLSAKLAASDNNLNYHTLMKKLNGILKNTTTLKYLDNA